MNLTSVVLTGADFSMTNGCVRSVAALGFCTIKVTFKPTATGALAGKIVITDSAPGSPRTITFGNGRRGGGSGGDAYAHLAHFCQPGIGLHQRWRRTSI